MHQSTGLRTETAQALIEIGQYSVRDRIAAC